ncbi:MAG: flagellar hook-basal body complex protein FliE [Terriglobales bacterium]
MIPPLLAPSLPLITPPTPPTPPSGGAGAGGFAGELQGALNQMESLQTNASHQVQDLLQGKSQDLHSSLIAVEKADLAFGMMLQLRNKAVDAYQQIANMAF